MQGCPSCRVSSSAGQEPESAFRTSWEVGRDGAGVVAEAVHPVAELAATLQKTCFGRSRRTRMTCIMRSRGLPELSFMARNRGRSLSTAWHGSCRYLSIKWQALSWKLSFATRSRCRSLSLWRGRRMRMLSCRCRRRHALSCTVGCASQSFWPVLILGKLGGRETGLRRPPCPPPADSGPFGAFAQPTCQGAALDPRRP